MARNKNEDKRVNVSGTVSPALDEFIESHRWANRKSKSEVVAAALGEWAAKLGFVEPKTGEEAAESSDATPQESADAAAEKDGAEKGADAKAPAKTASARRA